MFNILIADDEKLEREALKAILKKGIDSALSIHEAVNGRESIVTAKSVKPEIIFMDIKMPGIDGLEAAREIRKSLPEVSIVFLTAFNQFEYAQEAIQIGVDFFIIKPASEFHVIDVTSKLLSRIEERRHVRFREEDNRLKLERVKEYLETEFVYNLVIRGMDRDKFNNYLTILDVSFLEGVAGIVSIQFDTYPIAVNSDYHKQILRKRVSFIIKKILGDMGFNVLMNLELTSIYFIVVKPEDAVCNVDPGNLNWKEISGKIISEVGKEFSVEILMGFGKVFSDPGDSIASIIAAKDALSKNSNTTLFINWEIGLEEALIKGSRSEVMSVFQKLRESLESSNLSFEQTRQYLLELGTVIRHYSVHQFPEGIEQPALPELESIRDINTLMDEFKLFLNAFLYQRSLVRKANYSPAIEAACSYLEKKFRSDITLEEAAGKAGLSSFYFSKLFKKIKNVTFIEYLTLLRIDEAKKLLKETNMSIREISENIGYGDQNYFTRVFKKVVAMSPSAFRAKK
ncbi:MAG: hypothetical protein DRP59_05495 [Spirochaetes bacterium]|nr:MAG: hypothetical protein DRP59_05495 [Spirochaetota bacterium]